MKKKLTWNEFYKYQINQDNHMTGKGKFFHKYTANVYFIGQYVVESTNR